MIDKKKYFDLLYHCLNDNKLLPIEDKNQWRIDFQQYFEASEIDTTIISEMKVQYGIGFENVFLVNCKKCILICNNFGVRKNKLLIQTSVYFTVLGCLLDWLIDHGNAKQRQEAENKLSWDYCGDYFCKEVGAKDNSAIDFIYEKISVGMCEISHYNHERFEYIIDMMKLAIDSELAVCIENEKMIYNDIILNKSVLFVQIAAEIVLAEKESITSNDRKIIADIGYAFALIDDLCDLYEDMESGQMNLFRVYDIGNSNDIGIIIKSAVHELIKKLHIMEKQLDNRLYEFVFQEIREWSMSSVELRKRIWCIDG